MSQSTISLEGVFPPIPTPFDASGEVAYGALADNLARWNEYDLAGYVVLGSNGEGVLLNDEEKVRVWRAARQAIPAGKLLVAGTGCQSTRETIALTLRAAEAGADAALVVTPHYYGPKMTAEALVAHYETLAEASPIPVLIYNVPKFTGVNVDAAAVARASRHPNIAGIKDTSGNITQLASTVHLAAPGFQVLAGSASFLLAGLVVGAVGGILALANVAPDKALAIYDLFQSGRLDEAAALQRRMIPVNTAVTGRFGIAGLKVALEMLGYYGGPVRPPLLELDANERQELRQILVEGGILP
ncbi:MAG: dihydrodipicolinate synthase family protein [Anaerolineae bacterium]|jgi:4-hydroxy-2-oxoglutarate aldolase